ncbi:MAG: hypothetical protein JSV80_14125 [Acidobacteriota bacterium]|nr:MAG: hypothetical protein JSV80_14125 [Acidobacteriota bacterium]
MYAFPLRICLCLTLVLLGIAPTLPGSLEGDWRLVEQYYNEGRHNFVDPADELRLSFSTREGLLVGEVAWAGGLGSWPVYLIPDGFASIDDVTRFFDADSGTARANYRVRPAPGDDLWLVVEESYRLDPADDSRLLGTIHIAFERDGKRRGEFMWHRVFAREVDR